MDNQHILDELFEGERHNYETSKTLLGDGIRAAQMAFDGYDLIADLVKRSNVPPEPQVTVPLMFLLACQYELSLVLLTIMKGHTADAAQHLRRALELAGFAAYAAEDKAQAERWIEAGDSEETWKDFKKHFKTWNVFPKTKPRLDYLYTQFDLCSKVVHPSCHSLSLYIDVSEIAKASFRLNYFQTEDQFGLTATYHWALRTHFEILRVFDEYVFRDALSHSQDEWNNFLIALDTELFRNARRWLSLIPADVQKRLEAADPLTRLILPDDGATSE